MSSRHSHPSMANSYNYTGLSDDLYEHYSQAPQYLLPAQDPQTSTATYATHEMNRQWMPIANNRSSGLSFEHDASYKYGTSNFPYINSSVPAMGPHDSLFPEMGSLSKGLPQHRDRTLPNPQRPSMEPSNSYQKSGEFASYGPSSGLRHKSSVAWSPQTLTHEGSQGSISSTSLSAFSGSVSGPVGSVSTSPPTECSKQTTTSFGYVPLASSPLQQAISLSDAPEPEQTKQTTHKYRNLAQMNTSNGHTILPHRGVSSASLYGYTMGTGAKNGSATSSSSSDHTLITGQPYERIRQPPVKYNPSEPLPNDPPPPAIAPAPKAAVAASRSRQR
ncbi:MAG: hypothetical protein Q9166_000903 [cf. Caloplaca sp. 2 TL-2023]